MYYDLSLEKRVIEIVKTAVNIIKGVKFNIEEKNGCSNIVTSSDLKVQDYLVEKLKEIIPECGFYCEEKNLQDLSKDYIWVIDPIDGTTNYSRGIKECAISVGLLHKGLSVLGVVASIFDEEIFSATINLGARLNNQPIKVSSRTFEDGLLCTAMSLYRKEYAKICNDIIFETYLQCNDYRRFGSCAMELCYLACGRCDLYFEIRVFPWDYIGAYLILIEAGGVLKGYNKKPLEFNKVTPLVGANNEDNFDKLNKIVFKHMSKGGCNYE